jgi:hypothetical protein
VSDQVGGSSRFSAQDTGRAISTYRYLRVAIVTVVVTLLVSVGLERSAASCWNGSISAYYYTPVHSIFIAALGLIGIALFAIRGGNSLEEVLLNAAGFLAPVVAFVPTGWSSDYCPSNLTPTSNNTITQLLSGNHFFTKFYTNNLVAFIAGGIFSFILATLVFWRKNRSGPPKELWVPALGTTVVIVAGFIWYEVSQTNFSTHAHGYAAILMFILVGIVIISTALREESPVYTALYFACAGGMAAAGIAIAVAGALVNWRHQVLVLELIEITLFVIFWLAQTIELWDVGLATNRTQGVPSPGPAGTGAPSSGPEHAPALLPDATGTI